MSKPPNYSIDRQNRDRAKQAKKAAKAEEKAAAKHDVSDHDAPMVLEQAFVRPLIVGPSVPVIFWPFLVFAWHLDTALACIQAWESAPACPRLEPEVHPLAIARRWMAAASIMERCR